MITGVDMRLKPRQTAHRRSAFSSAKRLEMANLDAEQKGTQSLNKEKESETVTLMVRRDCRGVHGTRDGALCPACAALLEYARQRRDGCPHGEIDSRE